MFNSNVSFDAVPQGKGPHKDFEDNLKACNEFMNRTRSSWLPGMNCYLADGNGLKKALFMIVYCLPSDYNHGYVGDWYKGNYASAIFLHQPTYQVKNEIEVFFNDYYKIASMAKKRV